jgi:isoleucyl-tRNA synthetase
MISDSVSSRNIVSNGLVLDKNGNKMSKRLGNAVDPIESIKNYGADPVRWYMIVNSQPWDNLKFDPEGVDEIRRKFFGTLYNTYTFFALYANIDGFNFIEDPVPVSERPEIDRWIISLLNSLIKEVDCDFDDYEPTWAARAIQDFVIDNLSNWYVRLNRKRYWGGEYSKDKLSAYQTLCTCLETLTQLMAPLAPFYAERIFCDLNRATGRFSVESVHHTDFPEYDESLIDKSLEERMGIAQKISSMLLGLRRRVNIKVRQPLKQVLVPVLDNSFQKKVEAVENLILTEINVKKLEYLSDTSEILVKKVKPNFKSLGPRFGKLMKPITSAINQMTREEINKFEKEGSFTIVIDSQSIMLGPEDLEILSEDIPGWLVASDGNITVALDITVTDDLRFEGIAREFINRIQNYRKESGFDVTDKIKISIQKHEYTDEAVIKHKEYIVSQTLAKEINLVDNLDKNNSRQVEIDDDIITWLKIERIV